MRLHVHITPVRRDHGVGQRRRGVIAAAGSEVPKSALSNAACAVLGKVHGESFCLRIWQVKRMRVGDVIFRRRTDCETAVIVTVRLLDELVPLASPVAKATAHNSPI